MISLVLIVGWWAIGAYVAASANRNGYVKLEHPAEWAIAAIAWPWVLIIVRGIRKDRSRLQPFEDWVEKYDQEQIDQRLDDLE